MKLHIPGQSKPSKNAFPGHPRKVKKWLSDLPSTNMGEITRQIFAAQRDLNRQIMPGKHRLENMEQIREPVRAIFINLEKYFINRTLPLPEKSKKIVTLNQALLQEIAAGYMILVSDAANGIDKKIDKKSQTIAICRSIHYLSELLLRASEIYEETPVGVWDNINQLYLYAETQGIHKTKIDESEHPKGTATIEDTYKQALLFSLSRPTAMRQSDTERVFNNLINWASLTKLGNETHESQVNRLFCVRLDEDRPPSYLNNQDCESNRELRTLETTELVDTIRKQITEKDIATITVGENLSQDSLKTLSMSWGVYAKRRFSRAEKQGNIIAKIGMTNICEAIYESENPPTIEEHIQEVSTSNIPNLTLESIPLSMLTDQDDSSYMTHHELGNNENNAWDMVAKGTALTDTYQRQ